MQYKCNRTSYITLFGQNGALVLLSIQRRYNIHEVYISTVEIIGRVPIAAIPFKLGLAISPPLYPVWVCNGDSASDAVNSLQFMVRGSDILKTCFILLVCEKGGSSHIIYGHFLWKSSCLGYLEGSTFYKPQFRL